MASDLEKAGGESGGVLEASPALAATIEGQQDVNASRLACKWPAMVNTNKTNTEFDVSLWPCARLVSSVGGGRSGADAVLRKPPFQSGLEKMGRRPGLSVCETI